jgi:MFS transporter, FHS family, glucose/mannose:H+ symporter
VNTHSNKGIILFTGGAFFALFLMGFVDNLKGPVLPFLMQEFNFTYTQGGTIAMAAYLGFLVATLFTGVLADAAGKKVPLLLGGFAFLVGILGFTGFKSYGMLIVSMGVIGLGIGAFDLGANMIIVDLRTNDRGRYLSLMSVFHGIASSAAPYLAGLLLAAQYNWRTAYLGSLVLVIMMILFAALGRYPKSAEKSSNAMNLKEIGGSLSPQMGWLFVQAGCYMALEIGAASWLVEFAARVKGLPLETASLYVSLMFAGAILGRIANSFFIDRVGYSRMTLIYASAASLCLGTGIFSPAGLSFFLPLSGMFYAAIFSTTIAMVSELPGGSTGTIMGLLMASAGLGGMAGPWLVGYLGDRVGLQLGFSALLLFCLMIILYQVMVKYYAGRKQRSNLP